MRLVKLLLGLVAVAAIVVYGGRFLVSLADSKPLLMGLAEGPRGGCPSTDNCVSSLATEQPWLIGHLVCPGNPAEAEAAFGRAIESLERVEQVEPRAWIVRSRWLRFPDDVVIEPSARGLEVASSSRLGGGDLGVNRRRVELIAQAMQDDPACATF